jgi:hypothetical protein
LLQRTVSRAGSLRSTCHADRLWPSRGGCDVAYWGQYYDGLGCHF